MTKKVSCFCFSITLLNDRGYTNGFAIKSFEYGNRFDIVAYRARFVVMHPRCLCDAI